MRNQTDPGSKSAAEVQREVRESRAEVEQVLDAIQDRLSPGQMFDQAVAYLRGSGGREFLSNFGATLRDNPVPVALVGTGLAWLMLSGPRPRRFYDEDRDLLDDYPDDDDRTADYAAAYYEDVDFARRFGPEPAVRVEPGYATERGFAEPPDDGSEPGFAERASEVAEAAGAKVQGLGAKVLHDLNLALEEILANIISYGYMDKRKHEIRVSLSVQPGQIRVDVEDDGQPFNPLEAPKVDTTKPLEERTVGGLGIHLVRKLMDGHEYRREKEKNLLTMIKETGGVLDHAH